MIVHHQEKRKYQRGHMTKSIQEIDTNFRSLELDGVPLHFHPAAAAPFTLSGLPWIETEKHFCRLPQQTIPLANEGVQELAWHTSGGLLHFRTNSSAIALDTVLRSGLDMSHMPRSGSGGFDLFEGVGADSVFRANIHPEHGQTQLRGLFRRNLEPTMREWKIYLPLYNGVEHLDIGLDPDCKVEAPSPLSHTKPILFYGSSITQGGCASRPGNSYTAIVARRLDANMINWGFSGNGHGEPVMAETIATLDLGVFVFDYDHNAPTPEHLEKTHAPFFHTIRKAQANLPVVFVSRPDFYDTPDCHKRRQIIRDTYEEAKTAGDKNVYFVDGETLFEETERDLCTVDGCHPNDIGFLRMADGVTPAVKAALAGSR
jgi:hypothetical protein